MGVNYQGYEMMIVRYANNKDVTVEFLSTGEQKQCRYSAFKAGKVRADILPKKRCYWGWSVVLICVILEALILALCL